MNAIELIGFFVTMAIFAFYLLKGARDEISRRRNPEEYARRKREEDGRLRKVMKELNPEFFEEFEDAEEPEAPSPTEAIKIELQKRAAARRKHPEKKKHEAPPATNPAYMKETSLAGSYEVIRRRKSSRGMNVIGRLQSRRDMFILKEIFDKPLSMR